MYCDRCGNEVDINDQFCPNCGNNLKPKFNSDKGDNYEDEASKKVKTFALIVFIVSLVIFIANYLIYGLIVVLSPGDKLFIDSYLKPLYFIAPMVLGLVSIVVGIVYNKKAKVVKNVVIGSILFITSLLSLSAIAGFKNSLNNSYQKLTPEYVTYFESISGFLPIEREEYVIYLETTDENNNTYTEPVYAYLKITTDLSNSIFKEFASTSNKWRRAEKPGLFSYSLVYNTGSKNYNDLSSDGIVIFMLYSERYSSITVYLMPSQLFSMFAQPSPVSS